jgi:hypothetical protein
MPHRAHGRSHGIQPPGGPGRSLATLIDGVTLCDGKGQGERSPSRLIWSPDLGVLAVRAAGVLCAFCRVADALPGQCLRRRRRANPLVAAVFRTKRLLRERCSATCQRRRRPGQARHPQGGLQITAEVFGAAVTAFREIRPTVQTERYCASCGTQRLAFGPDKRQAVAGMAERCPPVEVRYLDVHASGALTDGA